MSLSDEAISLPSQQELPEFFTWKHPEHPVLREWSQYLVEETHIPFDWKRYFGPDRPWIGGQFFYPHWLVEIMNDDHRQWAEQLALSIHGGSRAVWIEHPSCWEVRAVR